MKKIFSLSVAVMLGGLLLASCDDDSTNEIATHGLQVVSAQTSFPATGGTQTITVAQTPIRVYTTDAWATVATSGTNINVTADVNPSRESRHSTVVVKSSEQDSAVVNIDQDGMVVSLGSTSITLPTGDEAGTTKLYLQHSIDVAVSSSASWLSASVEGDSLVLNAQANNSGDPRSGVVYYTSGNVSDSVTVLQYDVEKDVLGNYEMYYYYNRGWYYLNMTLSRKADGNCVLTFTDQGFAEMNFEIPVTISEDRPAFSISNIDSIGTYVYDGTPYTAIVMVMGADDNYIYRFRSTAIKAVAQWEVDDEGYPYWPVDATGLDDSYYFYALQIALSDDGTYAGYYDRLFIFPYCQFQKATPEEAETAKPGLAKKGRTGKRWAAPRLLPDASAFR